jgi:uncharacterized protein
MPNLLTNYISHWRSRIKSGAIKKDMVDTLICLAKCYVIGVIIIIAIQRHCLYHPTVAWKVNPADYHFQTVTYPTPDGITLTSWYAAPKNNRPVFVMFHGNAGNISTRVFKQRQLSDRGYGFLLAEYRGYGPNAEYPTEAGLYTDARAAMTWLMKTQKIDESRIVIYGQSIGSGPATQMALEYKKTKALVLEAPFTSTANTIGDRYWFLRPFTYLVLDQYNNLSKVPYIIMPLLIVNGDRDKSIPPAHGARLLAAAGSPVKKLVTLKGAGHNNLANHGLFDAIGQFIEAQ